MYDSNWLRSLATVQLLFLPTFFLWRHFAVLDLKPDEQAANPGPDQNNHDNKPRSSELDRLEKQLRDEAMEVRALVQKTREAHERVVEKENALGHHSVSHSLVPRSTDRTEVLE